MGRRKRGSLSPDEILAVSLEIIQKEGLAKLSMRRIASVLKCSVASPYAYFENREEIIKELILSGERKLTSDLKNARDATTDTDAYGRLIAVAHTYWNFAVENKELHKLMVNQRGGFIRTVFGSLPTSYRVYLDTVRSVFKSKNISTRHLKYSSVARTMWAWIYGLIVLEMNDMLKVKKDEDIIKEGVELFRISLSKL